MFVTLLIAKLFASSVFLTQGTNKKQETVAHEEPA